MWVREYHNSVVKSIPLDKSLLFFKDWIYSISKYEVNTYTKNMHFWFPQINTFPKSPI